MKERIAKLMATMGACFLSGMGIYYLFTYLKMLMGADMLINSLTFLAAIVIVPYAVMVILPCTIALIKAKIDKLNNNLNKLA